MKTSKLTLSIIPFLFAFAGALATKNSLDITGYFLTGGQPPCDSGNVDNGCVLTSPTNNVRCTIKTNPGLGKVAWQSGCTVAIYKPVFLFE